jgi:hypothetical protein
MQLYQSDPASSTNYENIKYENQNQWSGQGSNTAIYSNVGQLPKLVQTNPSVEYNISQENERFAAGAGASSYDYHIYENRVRYMHH